MDEGYVTTPTLADVEQEILDQGFSPEEWLNEVGIDPAELVGKTWLQTHNRVFIKE